MNLYMPKRVYIEPEAMDYELGRQLYDFFRQQKVPITYIPTHNRVTGIPGKSPLQQYANAKDSLVIGLKKDMDLATCKPSADYQFSLVTSCPGHCEYCYLQTTLGKKPYVRIYVNIDEILNNIQHYIDKNAPEITTFEGASAGDPLALEHLTGSLARTITFFGKQNFGRFRFVTKFDYVDPLLTLEHNGNTRFRFSLNSEHVAGTFESKTPPIEKRIEASTRVAEAGYPLGFIIAPIMVYQGWQQDYTRLLDTVADQLANLPDLDLTIELIQHRFTNSAKKIILSRFPNSQLDLDEESRKYKYGRYGRGKWVYPSETATELETFMRELIAKKLPKAKIEYFT